MVKIQKLEVTFDRENHVYWAGEKVSGNVTVITAEDMKLNLITFKVEGRGHVHWSEKWSMGDNSKTLHYVVDRPYLGESVDLWGKRNLNGDPMPDWLAAGKYEYPFEFELPEDAATSFEGENEGNVRYYVDVLVDIPMAIDHKLREHISVIGLMDLGHSELSRKGGRKTVIKEIGGGCSGAGQLEIQLSIPRLAYVPGEVIPITATVRNDTKKRVVATRAKLFQQTTFRAMLVYDNGSEEDKGKGRRKKKPEQTAGIPLRQTQQGIPKLINMVQNTSNITPGATHNWRNEGLLIPSVPPKLNTCPEIEIGYFLEFEVDFGSLSGTYPVQLPLIIGTIPRETVHMPTGTVSDGRGAMPIAALLRQGNEIGKPTFQTGHVNRGRQFTPMYPVYSVMKAARTSSRLGSVDPESKMTAVEETANMEVVVEE